MHREGEEIKMVKEEFVTPYSKLWVDHDGIVHYKYLLRMDVTLKSAKKEIELINKMGYGKKVPLIVNLSNTKSISKKAREYYSGEESAKVISAAALVVNSPVHKIMGNSFLSINKPSFPVKLFSSEKDAIMWLRVYRRD